MPAIQLALLRKQSSRLMQEFLRPAAFVRGLHDLLSFYADRTHRPGQAGEPEPLLAAYHVPAPVMRHLERELKPLALADSRGTLAMCDALWGESYQEFRHLAAYLLGLTPPEPAEPVLQRVQTWMEDGVDDQLLDALLNQGMAQVRHAAAGSYLQWISANVSAQSPVAQQRGVRGMLPLIADPGFENFPVLFRLMTQYARQTPDLLKPDVIAVLRLLAQRIPHETAYFFRQNLAAPDNPDTAWLIRQVLRDFPIENQLSLRSLMREG